MYIGHINLVESFDDAAANFVILVEALQQRAFRQYVVVHNDELAKRMKAVPDVTVGPTVRSAITAHSLIPAVDIVHIHDCSAWQAGLLLVLTRSIPFVLTEPADGARPKNPIVQSVYSRASEIIPCTVADPAEIVDTYARVTGSLRVPTMML